MSAELPSCECFQPGVNADVVIGRPEAVSADDCKAKCLSAYQTSDYQYDDLRPIAQITTETKRLIIIVSAIVVAVIVAIVIAVVIAKRHKRNRSMGSSIRPAPSVISTALPPRTRVAETFQRR